MTTEECEQAIAIVRKVRESMIDCLEKRADGRYYATEGGCVKLRGILAKFGINATVSIEGARFEVRLGETLQ